MFAQIAMWIQYLGMAIAVAGGAPWPKPNWAVVVAGLVVIGIGIVVKRWADRKDPRLATKSEGGEVREGSIAAAVAALPTMIARVKLLADEIKVQHLKDVAESIETIQRTGTEQVAAAQDAFVRSYTFAGYARVMTPLASGERWLYRAWSAAADGHRPEVIASVEAAMPYLEEAQTELNLLTGESAKSAQNPA